jgi:glycosyltransferase involved in cell wall biosynthesis
LDQRLNELGCTIYNIPFERSPWKTQNILAYRRLKEIIEKGQYNIVHTHTPVASAYTRLACLNTNNNTKVIYTAHGFHFYKGAPLINWLIYYPIERWLSKYTDVVITINQEDYERAKKTFKCKKVEYLPGAGIDVSKFRDVVVDRSVKRKELGIPEHEFMVLSVGELNKNKNHETVIKAVAKLRDPNVYYVICGQGNLENKLRKLAFNLGVQDNVKLLGYRRDIPEILKAADLFVFPSYREGLPVSLMEAMASGLPVICSNIRGNRDLMKHNSSEFLVKPNDVDHYSRLINQFKNESKFREIMLHQSNGIDNYSITKVNETLKSIYSNI